MLIALACRDLGDEDTALMDLRSARQTFAELGAAPDVARVDALLAPSPGEASSPLTGREAQVLQLVAAGKTNRQIAEDLVISEKTVARHISQHLLEDQRVVALRRDRLRVPARPRVVAVST